MTPALSWKMWWALETELHLPKQHTPVHTETQEKIWVYLLGSIQFVHILDFVILMPLGPLLMRTFHVTPSQFGMLVSSYTFAAGGANFLYSIIADRYERKRVLLVAFAGFLIGTLLCALAPVFPLLLCARIVAGTFGGVLNGVVFALVADLVPPQRRGAANGIVMSAFSLSSVLGVPIGLALAEIFTWHAPFLFIVAVGTMGFILAAKVLPQVHNQKPSKPALETLRQFAAIATERRHVEGFLLTSLLAFGIFMIIPFISPSMVSNVGLKESDLKYIYLFGGAATIFSARFIGRMCDKVGSLRMFTIVSIISFVPILLLTHLTPVPLWVALLVTTPFMMTGSGRFIPAMTLVSLAVHPQKRGTFMGLENAFRQVASGCSSLIAGLVIYQTADGRMENFGYLGIAAVVATGLAWFFARRLAQHSNLSS